VIHVVVCQPLQFDRNGSWSWDLVASHYCFWACRWKDSYCWGWVILSTI